MTKSRHLDPQELSRYFLRRLSADELLEADAHVHDCPDCRGLLARVVDWSRCLGELSAETDTLEHLSYEQIARYVENRLSEAQRAHVDRHVGVCDMCLAELVDLDQFAGDVNIAPEVVARRHRSEDLFKTAVVEQTKNWVRQYIPDFARAHLDVDRIVEEELVEILIRLDVIQRSDLGEHLCKAVQQRMRVHVRGLLLDLRPDDVEAVASLERHGLTFEEAVARVTGSSSKTVDFQQFRMRRGSGHRSTTSD
jgi:hypothetical protein